MYLRQVLALSAVLLLTGCCDPHVIGHATCETRRSLAEFKRTGDTDRFVAHLQSVDAGPARATAGATIEWMLQHPAQLEPFLAALPEVEREAFTCFAAWVADDVGVDEQFITAFEGHQGVSTARLVSLVRWEQAGDSEALKSNCDAAYVAMQKARGRGK